MQNIGEFTRYHDIKTESAVTVFRNEYSNSNYIVSVSKLRQNTHRIRLMFHIFFSLFLIILSY